mgnify:CR=1 FL=1
MNELSEAIEQAKQDCLLTGGGEVKINNDIAVVATWEDWDKNNNYDVVTIYISHSKFRYQLEETKIKR